jgi:hypothetical protein
VEATLETASQSRPRFRNDLVAQQLEEEGIQYVDVTDPNSGSTFRFYDVEYSIACGMNGERDLDGLVEWARADLGIETSPEELGQVMSTLAELGYLDAGMVEASPDEGSFELGDAGGGTPTHIGVPDIELGAPGATPATTTDEQADAHITSPAPELELGDTGAAPSDIHRQATRPVESLELGPPGASFDTDAMHEAPTNGALNAQNAVELGSDDLEEYKSQVTEMPQPPASAAPPPPPGTDDDMSFAGLMEAEGVPAARKVAAKSPSGQRPSADHTPTPPPPIEITADTPPENKRPTTVKFDADEPTNLPGAMPDDDDEDVSVDLSAHISLDKKDVEEAVRASRVMMVPEIPADLLKETAAPDDIDKTAPAMPLPPPPSTSQIPAVIDDAASRQFLENAAAASAMGATALPERPIAAVTSRPIETVKAPAGATGKKGGLGALWLFLLVLVLGGGVALYLFVYRGQGEQGAGTTAPPSAPALTPPPAAPLVPPTAPVLPTAKLAERSGSVSEAKAVTAGRVAWLSPADKPVAAGDTIVKLQGFQRWEQQKANALTRLDFYQGELDKAKAANNAGAVEKDEKKVQEKKDLINQADTELAKLTVVAPAAGKLEMVARLGGPVEAGGVVAKVSGGGPQLVGGFDAGAPGVAGDYKAAGATCQLVAKGDPDKRAACVVEGVEGSTVNVRVVDGSPFKAGDDVTLAPPK